MHQRCIYALFTCRRLNDTAGRPYMLCGLWLEEQTPEQLKDRGYQKLAEVSRVRRSYKMKIEGGTQNLFIGLS